MGQSEVQQPSADRPTRVNVMAMSADFTTVKRECADLEEAVRLFETHDWQREVDHVEPEWRRVGCAATPDMTFSTTYGHLVAAAQSAERFDVEVCLPRLKPRFGRFSGNKFYTLSAVPHAQIGDMVRAFCADQLEERHAYFSDYRGWPRFLNRGAEGQRGGWPRFLNRGTEGQRGAEQNSISSAICMSLSTPQDLLRRRRTGSRTGATRL